MKLISAAGAFASRQPEPAGKTGRMKSSCDFRFKRKLSLPPSIFTAESPCKQGQSIPKQTIGKGVYRGYRAPVWGKSSSVTLAKSLTLLDPQFSRLENGNDDTITIFRRLLS